MSLADCPKAHDEAAGARRQVALLRMPDERGIEERGAFERVFLREEGAEEQPPRVAERPVSQKVMLDRLVAFLEEVQKPLVPAVKLGEDTPQERFHLVVGKLHDTAGDLHAALGMGRLERAVEHPCVVRSE